MQVSEILGNIDRGALALPMFQRGYVWKRPQVKEMMNSLYRGFPVGSLLIWKISAEETAIRGAGGRQVPASGAIDVLLDGQQRVTSLYGLIRGDKPPFFDGDTKAFTGLYFHLEDEEFQFYSGKMATIPLWVSVTELFADGAPVEKVLELTANNAYSREQTQRYLARANRISDILKEDIPGHSVPEGIDTDKAVDIFNAVNKGGTKLRLGDLTLSRISGKWPGVKKELDDRLRKWSQAGFVADRNWLLRCITALVTNPISAEFENLDRKGIMPIAEIQDALEKAEAAVDRLLEATGTYLGMDTDKVHNSKNAFPVMVKYLVNNGGGFPNDAAKAELLHWYISVSIWGRFSSSTDTALNQDLGVLGESNPIEALRQNLILAQGNRTVGPENFNFNRTSARLYPLLHIMSRIGGARDWGTGRALPDHEPSPDTALELHHIFPKAYLRENEVSPSDANNFGNYAFQTRKTNRGIGNREPVDYMREVVEHLPGALESQWVPTNPDRWKVENYQEFLAERRHLLAEAANEFMESLRSGNLPAAASGTVSGELDADEEEEILEEGEILVKLNEFVVQGGIPAGELDYKVSDANGNLTATLDLAWPNGLQDGLSEPVAVLIGETDAVINAAFNAGFRHVFTSPDGEDFMYYVRHKILGEDEESEDESGNEVG